MLQRGGRRPPRHLHPYCQGACGRPQAEARRVQATADPGGVPRADGPGSTRAKPRGRTRRLRGTDGTVPAPPRPGGHGSSRSLDEGRRRRYGCAAGCGARQWRERARVSEALQFDPSVGQRHIIERPRLLKLLDETEARIILLVAPAGYGKTTLARQWLKTRREPRVWVRARDALSGVGLAAVIAQGISAEGDVGRRLRQRMRADGPQLDAHGAALLLADDLGDRLAEMTVVIDDIHTINGAQAEPVIDQLADMGCVVLATARDSPSFVTARRIVYGDIMVIGAADLRMDAVEVRDVLAASSEEEATALIAAAEGWPALVGLAAAAGAAHQRREVESSLYDFFAAEVLAGLPRSTRRQLGRSGGIAAYFSETTGGWWRARLAGQGSRGPDRARPHDVVGASDRSRVSSSIPYLLYFVLCHTTNASPSRLKSHA